MTVHLNLELTDRCNLNCRMCGQHHMPEVHLGPETCMSWDTWKALMDGLAGFPDEISLCPHWLGEPTFHPQFDAFVRYAFEHNSGNRLFRDFRLHTNGVKLDSGRADNLLACAAMAHQQPDTFRCIHFSVDALLQSTYRRVKGADCRDRVYRNILRFLERRRARGSAYPRVTLAFVVMPENRREAPGFLSFWQTVLAELGEEPEVSWDWPSAERDAIYFRRLNQEDQQGADELHRRVVSELALIPPGVNWQIDAESF